MEFPKPCRLWLRGLKRPSTARIGRVVPRTPCTLGELPHFRSTSKAQFHHYMEPPIWNITAVTRGDNCVVTFSLIFSNLPTMTPSSSFWLIIAESALATLTGSPRSQELSPELSRRKQQAGRTVDSCCPNTHGVPIILLWVPEYIWIIYLNKISSQETQ